MRVIALVTVMVIYLSLLSNAQRSSLEFGVNAGTLVYEGDLTPHELGDMKTMKYVFEGFISKNITNHVSVRLSLITGKIQGDDSKYEKPTWRKQRNYFFQSAVTELSAIVLWNVRGLVPNAAGIVNFTPYLFAGAGITRLNVRRDVSRFNNLHFTNQQNVLTGLVEDLNHEPPSIIPVIPFGGGVRMGVTPRLSIITETSYRHTFTDYLDGFSKGANPGKNDHYYSHTFGVVYTMGKIGKMECPVRISDE